MPQEPEVTRVPNLELVLRRVNAWNEGVVTTGEVMETIQFVLRPENFVPMGESWPVPTLYNLEKDVRCLEASVRVMSERLRAIHEHLGLTLPDSINPAILSAEVRQLVDEGQTIHAIQVHRRLTRTGLAEAKRAVDRYRGKPVAE
jgi:hypothetical protein